jgi:hypothetical protein
LPRFDFECRHLPRLVTANACYATKFERKGNIMIEKIKMFCKKHGMRPYLLARAVKMWADAEGIRTQFRYTKELGFELADRFMLLPEKEQLIYIRAVKSAEMPWWQQLFHDIREALFHTSREKWLLERLGPDKRLWTVDNILKCTETRSNER